MRRSYPDLALPPQPRRGGGRIVNVSSVAGFCPTGSSIADAGAKAGLNRLTRCLAVALTPNVLVNYVAPGLLDGMLMTDALDPAYAARCVAVVRPTRTTATTRTLSSTSGDSTTRALP